MPEKTSYVQKIDNHKMDICETDSAAIPSRADENTRTFKFKGFGFNLHFEWKKKSWMRL
jgi:hypothetical protein